MLLQRNFSSPPPPQTTSQFVNDVWSTMFVPPIFTLIVAGWWVMWIIGYVYLYSVDESGTIKKDAKYPFADVQHSTHVTRMLWAYFFVGLWVNAFIQAICQFVLAVRKLIPPPPRTHSLNILSHLRASGTSATARMARHMHLWVHLSTEHSATTWVRLRSVHSSWQSCNSYEPSSRTWNIR